MKPRDARRLPNRPPTALIHSPLVGPSTWADVATVLTERGVSPIVPVLPDLTPNSGSVAARPARAVADQTGRSIGDAPVVLVGHSGAGPLLPAIGAAPAPRTVAVYIFVDAGLPNRTASRLDLLATELPAVAGPFRAHLEAGGRYP